MSAISTRARLYSTEWYENDATLMNGESRRQV